MQNLCYNGRELFLTKHFQMTVAQKWCNLEPNNKVIPVHGFPNLTILFGQYPHALYVLLPSEVLNLLFDSLPHTVLIFIDFSVAINNKLAL